MKITIIYILIFIGCVFASQYLTALSEVKPTIEHIVLSVISGFAVLFMTIFLSFHITSIWTKDFVYEKFFLKYSSYKVLYNQAKEENWTDADLLEGVKLLNDRLISYQADLSSRLLKHYVDKRFANLKIIE